MADSNLYKDRANVRLEFYKTTSGADATLASEKGDGGKPGVANLDLTAGLYHKLYGFLTDEGLSLKLNNEFAPSLDLVGGLLGQMGELFASARAFGAAVSPWGASTTGYVTSGLSSDTNIILNAPMMWKGTQPISFSVSVIQIADTETEIIQSYQSILEVLSPWTGKNADGTAAGAEVVNLNGQGPGLVFVHYFPQANAAGKEPVDQKDSPGKIQFGPCLCEQVSMEIKPPYSSKYMPILGVYNFALKTSRIMDRSQIAKLFGKTFPSGTGAAT